MHGIIVAIIIATKSSFQLMASQLRCSTIGPKTPASSGVAPQRAGSTRYRASVVDHARMYRAPPCTNRHTAATDNAMGAPLSAFFFAFIFYENRWFDINLRQILIEFRWCETLSRLVQASLYIRATPCVCGFAYNTLRACWSHSETLLFAVFRAEKCRFKTCLADKNRL